MADLYASPVGTCVLINASVPERPALLDGAIIIDIDSGSDVGGSASVDERGGRGSADGDSSRGITIKNGSVAPTRLATLGQLHEWIAFRFGTLLDRCATLSANREQQPPPPAAMLCDDRMHAPKAMFGLKFHVHTDAEEQMKRLQGGGLPLRIELSPSRAIGVDGSTDAAIRYAALEYTLASIRIEDGVSSRAAWRTSASGSSGKLPISPHRTTHRKA